MQAISRDDFYFNRNVRVVERDEPRKSWRAGSNISLPIFVLYVGGGGEDLFDYTERPSIKMQRL